jgi:rhodanese-related sulfurtransferase
MGHPADDLHALVADDQCTMFTPSYRDRAQMRGGAAMTLTLAQMIATARSQAREILPAEACEALNSAQLDLVLDVRERDEYREGHVPDAVNIPRGLVEIRADPSSPARDSALSADRSARILVYCTKGPGARSLLAAQTLASMGYEHVEVLGGGLVAWAEAGLPVERDARPVNA